MVNKLPADVTQDELREKFEKFGEIGDVFLPKHYDTGRGKGFGFVRFVERNAMEDCLDRCGDRPILIDDEEIRVEPAKPRPDTRDRRQGGGGGGRDNYYRRSPPRYGGRDRSPPRRDRYDDRRERSPRRDYNDRRGGGRY